MVDFSGGIHDMEKSENVKFLEALAAQKGITDPEQIHQFVLNTVFSWIAI